MEGTLLSVSVTLKGFKVNISVAPSVPPNHYSNLNLLFDSGCNTPNPTPIPHNKQFPTLILETNFNQAPHLIQSIFYGTICS